jgi:salicylate hydroxylase
MGAHYAETPQMFLGKNTHILTFPIDKFETINVVAFTTDRDLWPKRPSKCRFEGEDLSMILTLCIAEFPENDPWTQETTQEDMIKGFEGWGPDMISILKVRRKALEDECTSN